VLENRPRALHVDGGAASNRGSAIACACFSDSPTKVKTPRSFRRHRGRNSPRRSKFGGLNNLSKHESVVEYRVAGIERAEDLIRGVGSRCSTGFHAASAFRDS
jgi:hypothetical protein